MNREEVYRNLNNGVLQERFYAFDRNLSKNINLISRFGGLAPVVSDLRSKHIIIVAAGQSLFDALPYLAKLQQRNDIAIICVDMALSVLASYGIRAAYSISCETTPRNFFTDIDSSSTTLLAFSCASHSTIRTWRGKLAFYNWLIRQEPYESLWNRAGYELGFVATGSVVTTQALSIALGVNAASVTLVGNDLAFYDLPYCKGVSWYSSAHSAANRLSTVESKAHSAVRNARAYEIKRGDKTYVTNNQFLGAKYWIEDLLAKTEVTVFDMSCPGVSEKYVKKISPKNYEHLVVRAGERKRGRKRR